MEAECLAFVAEVTGPLVHWASLLFAIPSSLLVGFVFGRLGQHEMIRDLRDQIARWKIVAKTRGWNYTIKPLRGIDILANLPEE